VSWLEARWAEVEAEVEQRKRMVSGAGGTVRMMVNLIIIVMILMNGVIVAETSS
jgi:hypothetical protein